MINQFKSLNQDSIQDMREFAKAVKKQAAKVAQLKIDFEKDLKNHKQRCLLEWLQLNANFQLLTTGEANVSLRDYSYDFYNSNYGMEMVFMMMLKNNAESNGSKAFNDWLKETGLTVTPIEVDDGCGVRSWLEIKFE